MRGPERTPLLDQIRALEDGRAFVVLSTWRAVLAEGSDALPWLNDLVTADLAGLVEGEARRTLLLDRTGHIRADFHVGRIPEGLLLLQDDVQPRSVADLLELYVLSSDVSLHDRSGDVTVFAGTGIADAWGPGTLRPSPFGSGAMIAVAAERADQTRDAFAQELVEVGREAAEAWRIRRGEARVGVDVGETALPGEAGLDRLVDQTKGCFLGQESVAKVRNLGHPRHVVVNLSAPHSLFPGEPVVADGTQVGMVTGLAPRDDGAYAVLARVRWDAREADLATAKGVSLRRP
jgi:tRNA-modifying protein YgfZ